MEIQKKLESAEPTQKKLLKNIKDIFKPKKSLQTSKSTNNLLLEMPGSKNSKSKHKTLLLDKNVKTLKSSSSMGNFLVKRKKCISNSNSPLLNLNTVKPKTSQINTNINSINMKIKSTFSNNNGNGAPKLEKAYRTNFKKNFKDHDTN